VRVVNPFEVAVGKEEALRAASAQYHRGQTTQRRFEPVPRNIDSLDMIAQICELATRHDHGWPVIARPP